MQKKEDCEKKRKTPIAVYIVFAVTTLVVSFFVPYFYQYVKDLSENSFILYTGEYEYVDNGSRDAENCYLLDENNLQIRVDPTVRTDRFSREELEEGVDWLVYTKYSKILVDAGKNDELSPLHPQE